MKSPKIIECKPEDVQVIHTGCELGEGVLWDEFHQEILWTDILGKKIYFWAWMTGQLEVHELEQRLCSISLVEGPNKNTYLFAFESGVALWDRQTQSCEWIEKINQPEGVRLNDGRTDRQGRFWVGSMGEGELTSKRMGQLYCVDRGKVTAHADGIGISNGLCWSPDSATMYFADSLENKIEKIQFGSTQGKLVERKDWVRTPQGVSPDGSCVDQDGYVWNAQWGGSRVIRYRPDGDEDVILSLPMSQPSCVCFAGPELDTLAVTSAKQGLTPQQLNHDAHAGNVFLIKLPYRGLLESRYIS
ncbi:MAG: SMP-30/gluconolactonase/LRE family protein [Bdellovibrionota bacterium]